MINDENTQARSLRSDGPKGWHDRGYLPHFDGGAIIQFVTYRLADSLPRSILLKIKFRLDAGQISEIEYHREIQRVLDKGFGPNHLRNESIAGLIEENLLRFNDERYSLLHWVIMPNHVHVLLRPAEGFALASIMHSMKSYTANRANKLLGRAGRFWSIEYFDRYIRNLDHYERTVAYIHVNPVKAGLSERAIDWHFGCARRHE